MPKTVILIIILFTILAVLEISNIIWAHRAGIKARVRKFSRKFKKKGKIVQFD